MNSENYFEKARFNYSWEVPATIELFGTVYSIVAAADAYFNTEKVTREQNDSYKFYLENYNSIVKQIEELLIADANGDKILAQERFVPKMLKIKKNGDCAILLDDKADIESGVAASIIPDYKLMNIDEYI